MPNVTIQTTGYTKVIDGKITMLSLDVLEILWPKIVKFFEKSREWWEEYYELDDILHQCRVGDMQLWVAVDKEEIFAVGLTSIGEYPKCRILKCMFLAGRGAKEILPCVRGIEEWAAMLGCSKSEIVGRLPWKRLAKPYGYVERSVVLTKQLVPNVIPGFNDRRH